MYKNRKSKTLAPLTSSQNHSSLRPETSDNQNILLASTSASQTLLPNPAQNENADPGVSQPKKMRFTERVAESQDDDMFAIPSSQNPTQSRFSSQRSILARTQSILAIQRQPKNYFESVLIKCGVGLESIECYILTCNHLNFTTKIKDILKNTDNFPENIKDFISGLTDTMKTYLNLTKLFTSCKLSLPTSDNIYQSQESLIKDLLMIDFLQKDLIEVLFKKIETFITNDETLKLDVPYVDLMLSELKYLNIVEHGDVVLFKIFEIFESATTNYQQIIIRSMPDIIDVTRHNEAMEKLMRIIPEDEKLLAFSNVDTFGNMHLNAGVLGELRKKIINHMKYKAPYEMFPSFVKFILRINNNEMETLPQLISDLRHCIRWKKTTENQNEMNANQKEVFDCFVRSLCASKQIYDIWLKTILTTSLDQKSIDFIILLIMMKINEDKKLYIEQLIRKKIKSEQFHMTILGELVDEFASVLTEYLTVFISILDSLFHDKNDSVVAFATHGFNTLFNVNQFNKKVLLSKLVGYVCQNQLGSDKAGGFDVATNALRILTEFNENNPTQMQKHGLQLLRMLDRASELTLTQYRMIMNILSSIAYPLPPITGSTELQNHIDMLLKKQIASSIPTIKNLGIVGVVQTIEHLIWTNESDESCPPTQTMFQCIDDIDDSAARCAAQYLDLVLSATRNSPASLGLCFDELAAVLSHRNKNHRKKLIVNKSFEIWVTDFIVEEFQKLFVVDELPPNLDIECEYQYHLNSPDENNTEGIEHIAMNIAGLTFKPSSNPLGSVLLLPSFFNLLRTAQFHRDGNLIAINALLGCAIVLPKSMNSPSEMEIFEDYDENKAKKLLDLYYLTVNWMREAISAFVSQNCDGMQKKNMIRLSEVIKLEEKIRRLLRMAPTNYTPPICQFICSPTKQTIQNKAVGAPSRTSKKKITAPDVIVESQNNTLFETIQTQRSVANAPNRTSVKVKINFNTLNYGPKEIFRQMDPDIVRLLNQELLIKYPLPPEKFGEVLGLLEFKFLMGDLVIKMESVFGVKQFVSDQPLQYVVSPSDLVHDLINFLPQIMQFFIQLTDHLQQFVQNSESENDRELYTDELNYTKICIGLCLRLFAAFFSWSNFQLEAHKNLLRESLAAIVQVNESEVEETISELSLQAIDNIVSHSSTIWDLGSAVHMFHVTRSLAMYSADPRSNERVVTLCNKFLSKKWYDYDGMPERGGQCNVLLDDLLKGLMKSATFSKIKEIMKIAAHDIKELCNKNDCLKSFPNFYKTNVALLYRSLCSALIVAVNAQLGKSAPTSAQLKVFDKSTALLQILADMVGVLNIPRNYGIFLKHAHIYIKIFLHHGIPLIQTGLRSNCDQILQFLGNFNQIAKFLHKICCHWKANQNNAIMAQIPFVRETIETLLIKVKAVLAANNCSAAFWQNNLKNKNLHDEEILTQSTENDEDENDDELPEDDDSLEDECLPYERRDSRETSVDTTKRCSKMNSDSGSLLI